jgi:hypothetical protein
MNQEQKAIFQERLYQLQTAVSRLKQSEGPCREIQNILQQVRTISFSSGSLALQEA